MELTHEQRHFLVFAMEAASEEMFSNPNEFNQEDWDALAHFRRVAAEDLEADWAARRSILRELIHQFEDYVHSSELTDAELRELDWFREMSAEPGR